MRHNEFTLHSVGGQDTAPQTAKIAAIKKQVSDSERMFVSAPAHMQTGFDFDDEQWGRQIEHELEVAKKRYLQGLLNDEKRNHSDVVLNDNENDKIIKQMAQRATRKKR